MSMPSPSLPPKIPTRSLAPVVIALLVGVAIIVVVVIEMTGSSTPAPRPEVTSAAAPPPAAAAAATAAAPAPPPPAPPPSTEQPPPPPPPAPVAEAPAAAPPAAGDTTSVPAPQADVGGAKSVVSGTKSVVGSPGPKRDQPCADPCRGSATDELVRALGAKGAQARSCYERALSNNSALSGRLEVALRVGPSGAPCSAKLASDTLGDAAVAACVLSRFKSGTFPKPAGGCVDASVPINFKPAGG